MRQTDKQKNRRIDSIKRWIDKKYSTYVTDKKKVKKDRRAKK